MDGVVPEPGMSVITVISGGAKTRNGGPHVPVPRLTYSLDRLPISWMPVVSGYIRWVTRWNGNTWPP
jgi:hypothetical protein